MYWAFMTALATWVSSTATTMSPLGVRSMRLICQSCAKPLTCCISCSASSFQVSLVSPLELKYADAYIVIRLSGVMLSSAIASSSTSLVECFARCITALLYSDIISPSHGVVRFVPVVWGICAPPLVLPTMYRDVLPHVIYSLSGMCGRSGFHDVFM